MLFNQLEHFPYLNPRVPNIICGYSLTDYYIGSDINRFY